MASKPMGFSSPVVPKGSQVASKVSPMVPKHAVGESPVPTVASPKSPTDALGRLSIAAESGVQFRSAHFSAQGPRPTQEDRFTLVDDGWAGSAGSTDLPRCAFYAVFDGHGGVRAAKVAARELWKHVHGLLLRAFSESESGTLGQPEIELVLQQAFAATEQEILQQARRLRWDDGCTAVAALLLGSTLAIANLGDSRAVLCSSGQAVRLSRDHKPNVKSERERIVAAGGSVRVVMGIARLNGGLSLSRAFGDASHKPAAPVKLATSPARVAPSGNGFGAAMASPSARSPCSPSSAVSSLASRGTGALHAGGGGFAAAVANARPQVAL